MNTKKYVGPIVIIALAYFSIGSYFNSSDKKETAFPFEHALVGKENHCWEHFQLPAI